MLRDMDNSSGGGELPTDGITGAPEKRGRGRPKGSKNKVSADAREMLASHGPAGIEMLCRIAAGKTVYRPRAGGSREKLVPDLDQMLAAQKIIVDRLVPTLKAQELTVEHVGEEGPTDTRDLARSVLDVLRMAEIEDAPPPEAGGSLPPPPATHAESEAREPVSTPEPENPTGIETLSETASETHLSNGARVVGIEDAHGDLTRWRPIDLRGMQHHAFNDRAEAVEFAKGLQGIRAPARHPASVCYSVNGVEVDGDDIPRELRTPLHRPRPRVLNSRRN